MVYNALNCAIVAFKRLGYNWFSIKDTPFEFTNRQNNTIRPIVELTYGVLPGQGKPIINK